MAVLDAQAARRFRRVCMLRASLTKILSQDVLERNSTAREGWPSLRRPVAVCAEESWQEGIEIAAGQSLEIYVA